MADKGYVVITLRREVPDRDTAKIIYDFVKERMSDRPDVEVTGHFSNHFDFVND